MNHREEVNRAVEAALANNVIREMNTLLCALSEDPELSREERYSQQQRLRMAVFKHSTEKQELAEPRRNWRTRGGIIGYPEIDDDPEHPTTFCSYPLHAFLEPGKRAESTVNPSQHPRRRLWPAIGDVRCGKIFWFCQ